MLILILILKRCSLILIQYRQRLYASQWSHMRTFGVRTLPRVLLLVITDLEDTFSATELERFRLRPFPVRDVVLLAMR